ncbi:VOC family protein [Hydrogenophaga sp.]|uniref:VOC family protein n=1 Tax=Hydrogenophaga sp. TaxID=1904254 RepID=UPI00271E5A46|nr:VOC family protein [Hydrogenophaga sp.]MDO9435911.1 VOC family protein [Hydrogenophaga sp.]
MIATGGDGDGDATGRILALTHVGFLTDDIERSSALWEQLFGAKPAERRPIWFASEEGVLATFLPIGSSAIEPLQPLLEGTMQRRELLAGRRAFHLSFRVKNLAAVMGRLRAAGFWTQLRVPGRVVTVHRGWVDRASSFGMTLEFIDVDEVKAFRASGPMAEEKPPATPWLRSIESVGHCVRDIEVATRMYVDKLGFVPLAATPVLVEEEGYLLRKLRLPAGPAIDLVQPVNDRTVFSSSLADVVEGMAYVAIKVSDFSALEKHLVAQEAWVMRAHAGRRLPDRLWVHDRSTDGLRLLLIPDEG